MIKAKKIKETKNNIIELSKNPAEADTVAALKRQLADKQARLCVYAKDTGNPYSGCAACGGRLFICNHPKVIGKRRNSKGCNPTICRFFESVTSNIERLTLNVE